MILLGVVHVSLTPVYYPAWTEDAFWFAGTGMGLFFGGLANYMNLRINLPVTFGCALVINILMLGFGTALSFFMPGHVPALCVTIVALLLLICCIVQKKKVI